MWSEASRITLPLSWWHCIMPAYVSHSRVRNCSTPRGHQDVHCSPGHTSGTDQMRSRLTYSMAGRLPALRWMAACAMRSVCAYLATQCRASAHTLVQGLGFWG